MWRIPSSAPRKLDKDLPFLVEDMTNRGDLTGSTGGFRGISDRAWLSDLGRDEPAVILPNPPTADPEGWQNIFGRAVIRGVTPFASAGGVSVGGAAQEWDGTIHPVIWTCAQTY